MRIAIVLLSSVAFVAPASAQHADVLPWMTGERLLKLLGNVDPRTLNWTPDSPFRTRAVSAEQLDRVNAEFVRGYIQAVHDATEGKAWCWSDRYHPKPDELEDDARNALQRMTSAQLKRNAADLVTEVWLKQWPCPAAHRSAP